jgi:hypothetical protein
MEEIGHLNQAKIHRLGYHDNLSPPELDISKQPKGPQNSQLPKTSEPLNVGTENLSTHHKFIPINNPS